MPLRRATLIEPSAGNNNTFHMHDANHPHPCNVHTRNVFKKLTNKESGKSAAVQRKKYGECIVLSSRVCLCNDCQVPHTVFDFLRSSTSERSFCQYDRIYRSPMFVVSTHTRKPYCSNPYKKATKLIPNAHSSVLRIWVHRIRFGSKFSVCCQ